MSLIKPLLVAQAVRQAISNDVVVHYVHHARNYPPLPVDTFLTLTSYKEYKRAQA